MKDVSENVAQALLSINAVGFTLHSPITFKSGILSPIYIDNRILPYHPKEWRVVLDGFTKLIELNGINFDVIAGIETAGIPHSATLGYLLHKPTVFCRKQTKDHGTKKLIEGGEVFEKKVVLIEDLVTTGGSSLAGVASLIAAGATVSDCLAIVSYEFQEARVAFEKAQVNLSTLTTFDVILNMALAMGRLNHAEAVEIRKWHNNPFTWRK